MQQKRKLALLERRLSQKASVSEEDIAVIVNDIVRQFLLDKSHRHRLRLMDHARTNPPNFHYVWFDKMLRLFRDVLRRMTRS